MATATAAKRTEHTSLAFVKQSLRHVNINYWARENLLLHRLFCGISECANLILILATKPIKRSRGRAKRDAVARLGMA